MVQKQVKVCKFYWAHLRQIILGVGKSPTKNMSLKEWGAQQHSAKAWLQGHGKSGHLSDRLRQKGTPEVLYLYLT